MSPRPDIDQVRSIGDFQSLFRWNLIISVPPSSVSPFPSTDDLNLRCLSAAIPKRTNSPMTINVRGHEVHQPGITKPSGTIQLSFIETVDSKIKEWIKAWRDAIWDPVTGVMLDTSDTMKATITLMQLDNQDNPVWQYVLFGAFPTDYELGQLENSGDTPQQPSITLQYDYFKDSVPS